MNFEKKIVRRYLNIKKPLQWKLNWVLLIILVIIGTRFFVWMLCKTVLLIWNTLYVTFFLSFLCFFFSWIQNFPVSTPLVLISSCPSLEVFVCFSGCHNTLEDSLQIMLYTTPSPHPMRMTALLDALNWHHTLWEWLLTWKFQFNIMLYSNRPNLEILSDLPAVKHHDGGDEWPFHKCSVLNQFKYH